MREIHLRVDQGESMAVVGPSGSGKSTLLNIIGALERPSSGKVMLGGNHGPGYKGRPNANYMVMVRSCVNGRQGQVMI